MMNRPLANVAALTLNPSLKFGRRGWGMRASSGFYEKFNVRFQRLNAV